MSKQAIAPKTIIMNDNDFKNNNNTVIYWLGNASIFINSYGSTAMIDPLLEGFDMPLLIDMPILPKDVPQLDAVLLTHCDNDHFSRKTCRDLASVTKEYHAPHYVKELLKEENIDGIGHDIKDSFSIGNMQITLTPADHAWQNEKEKYRTIREYRSEDYCGFWIETKDGTIWLPGDSRLMKEQLEMPEPDVILFDFSDNSWHIGLDNAITLANNYPNSHLILIHWGSVDAPEMDAFNGNPESLKGRVVNEERIHILAPGEGFKL
ncbi:MAG: MBL fold metallo-hydrolase [Coprobacillaceae bacterium]